MMSFSNSKLEQGLNVKYEERAKQNKSSYKNINNKTVNDTEFNGSESYRKMKEGLSKSEKKAEMKEVSFREQFTLDRKYFDEIFNSKNVNETILLINSMQKRSQELRGYLLSNLVSRREDAEKELADINYVFDTYKDKIENLVKNGVLQRSGSSDALFRIE